MNHHFDRRARELIAHAPDTDAELTAVGDDGLRTLSPSQFTEAARV